ncbi:MAG: ketoacyl-ACP synthase III [Lachnospiraceae bacterium]|nr:ketoacyl-ACP synthase III [Lachnospiraceae bacterium]
MTGLHIVATGMALPTRCVSNDDLAKTVDTNDEWIQSRTGIRSRYYTDGETNWELASRAAELAIQRAGISTEELGACIVATITSDYATPSVACMVQKTLELPESIPSFDINAACSGFLYGLEVAHGLLQVQKQDYILLIGSEQLSRVLDFEDRSTCILFGDGAAAAIIKRSSEHAFSSILGASGNDESLYCGGTGSERQKVYMDGKAVFRFAVETIPKVLEQILQENQMTLDDIDYVVCHQANERIIEYVRKKMKADESQFYINIDHFGNTSAASIPLALAEMDKKGMLGTGKKIICVGFGAGFTWGGALLTF